MNYRNIKRVIACFMSIALFSPLTLAVSDSTYAPSETLPLAGNVQLSNSKSTITLSLRDSDVKQVLRMFADKAGLNVVFHKSVEGKVTLDLVNSNLNDAFNIVLQIAGLNYYKQGNTMIIIAKSSEDNSLYSKQDMYIFPVRHVSAAKIATFLNKNVFALKKTGLSSVDAATVNSATNELIVFGMPSDIAIVKKVIEQFDKAPISRTYKVNHTTPAEMANMICEVLLPSRGLGGDESSSSGGGGSSAGGSSGTSGSAGSSSGSGASASSKSSGGVPTGGAASSSESSSSSSSSSSSGGSSSSSLKLGEGILACSTSVSSTSDTIAPFDVQNLSIAYFPQRGTVTMMGGTEMQAKMIEDFIKTNDVKQPQAMLEVQIVELNEDGSKEFANQWDMYTKNWAFQFDGSSTSISRPGWYGFYKTGVDYYLQKDELGNITGENAITTHFPVNSDSPHISWYMNYLIKNGKGRTLANPKIMITNGQTSKIEITQDYVEKVTSQYTSSAGTSGYNNGVVERTYDIGSDLGITVELTPFISPEGYVTLNIKPEYSTIASQVTVPQQVGTTITNDVMATLLNKRNLELNNLRIKDGETLVIGGLIQEVETKSVAKIPFLGDIPVIGVIFRSTSTSKTKNELVIMITPKIIDDGDTSIGSNTL